MFDFETIVQRIVGILLLAIVGAFMAFLAYCANQDGISVLPHLLGFVCGCCIGWILAIIDLSIRDVVNYFRRKKAEKIVKSELGI